MINRLHAKFSWTFEGTIWNTLLVPETKLLILEARNDTRREASFSALDFESNRFLWKDILFEEHWWIGLTAATAEVLLLHLYQGTENPDKKGLMAWHIYDQKKLWQLDNFSFTFVREGKVHGHLSEEGNKVVAVDIMTGRISENNDVEIDRPENILTLKPFLYVESSSYFDTVKSFLAEKLNVKAVAGIEYLEYDSLIFISYHVQQDGLTNFLMVVTIDGNVVLHEILDERLKGLGVETFFILSGCLFFVRNKRELVSYRIV